MNKKILFSLSTLMLVSALVVAGTVSYYNDVEESTDNTFEAGALDLKIDSTAHYNGLVCDGSVWQCDPFADRVVDFEQGTTKSGNPVPADRSDPTKALGEPEDNDTINFFSLGLNVDVGIGGTLILGFDNYIINGPGDDIKIYETSYGSPSCEEYPEKARVWVSQYGTDWDELTTEADPICIDALLDMDSGDEALPWAKYIKIQDVTNPDDFSSSAADGYDVDGIEALYCETFPNLAGLECEGTWEEADLGAEKFFYLDDIKPGDHGENTISLHVYDNNAWGRVVLNNIGDSDSGCVEPEVEVDHDCEEEGDEGGDGELRENLLFSVWLDEGVIPGFQGGGLDFGEGDNIKQEAEPSVAEPAVLGEEGGEWNLWEVLMAARDAHPECEAEDADGDGDTNYGVCHGLAADGHLVGSVTYYFGVDWRLPPETGNEVQSDSLSGDLGIETVQYRNNPDHQF